MFVKLLDFGLARPTDDGSPGITVTGEMLGTPRYMSPEQLSAKPLTPASDISSLGIVFLEMLIGAAPLQGNRWSDQFDRMMTGHVFSFPELQRIGPDLVTLMHQMTAADPQRRPGSALAILDKLAGPRPSEATSDTSPGRLPWYVAALVALGLLLGLALFLDGRGSKRTPTLPAPPKRGENANPLIAKAPNDSRSAPEQVRVDVGVDGGSPDLGLLELAPGCSAPEIPPGQWWIDPDASERALQVYTPAGYRGEERLPLVFMFPRDLGGLSEYQHDTTNGHRRHFVTQAGFPALADKERFAVVIPPASHKWNLPAEDVPTAKAALERTAELLCIDRTAVFAVGDHDGAWLAHPLSKQDWITAVAFWAIRLGTEGNGEFFDPRDPDKPLIYLMPNDSLRQPLGEVGKTGCHAKMLSFAAWKEKWRKRNGCSARQHTWEPGGGFCQRYVGCNSPTVVCELHGGYNWPGTEDTGRRTRQCGWESFPDYPLTETIWAFFEDAVQE